MYYDPLAPRSQTTTRDCDNLPPVNDDENGNQNGGSENNGNVPSTPDVTPPLQPEQPMPPQNGTDSGLPADSIDPKLLSLAMGFVPYQSWDTPYTVDVGFDRGTIFPGLDKPFLGEPPLSATPLQWGV